MKKLAALAAIVLCCTTQAQQAGNYVGTLQIDKWFNTSTVTLTPIGTTGVLLLRGDSNLGHYTGLVNNGVFNVNYPNGQNLNGTFNLTSDGSYWGTCTCFGQVASYKLMPATNRRKRL